MATISGLGQGLPRHRGELGRTSLPKLLATPPEQLAKVRRRRAQTSWTAIRRVALADAMPVADRVTAIELLAYQPFADAAGSLEQLLAPEQPVAVQSAAINALSREWFNRCGEDHVASLVGIGTAVRGPALTMLLRRIDSTRLVLDAMAEKKISPGVLSIDQRVRLLKHNDPEILAKAKKLLAERSRQTGSKLPIAIASRWNYRHRPTPDTKSSNASAPTATESTGKVTRPGPI